MRVAAPLRLVPRLSEGDASIIRSRRERRHWTDQMSDGSSPTHFPGLYVRFGDDVREAPAADQAVARSYPNWPDKGTILHSRRLTILTAHQRVRSGDEVRVIHVAEAMDPSAILYTMGPKTVLGEDVDGKLATALQVKDADPLRPPGLYDGPVVKGPAVDYGYDVSTYRFEATGPHRIVWRLGDLVSNELFVLVE
jgi:hypothetical protein